MIWAPAESALPVNSLKRDRLLTLTVDRRSDKKDMQLWARVSKLLCHTLSPLRKPAVQDSTTTMGSPRNHPQHHLRNSGNHWALIAPALQFDAQQGY